MKKKINSGFHFFQYTNCVPCAIRLKVKVKIQKCRRNIEGYFYKLGLGKDFFNWTQRTLTIKKKIDKSSCLTISVISFSKENIPWSMKM